ncbi:MAG TPA: GNAT family N-acetyltransferase [Pyrinomonadaceae bacterium]|jgi:GNAT superfamily N-acetyltransferase
MTQEEIPARAAPRVTLRPVASDDEEFLVQVYASTRADELAQIPWSEAQRAAFVRMQFDAQLLHYRTHNPAATYDIILLDGRAAGRLYVARRGYEIRILDLTLLPEHRGEGVGTFLVKQLVDEAARAGLPLNIYVESYNRSRGLFERLGFKKVDRADDDGINYLLEWRRT